MSTTSNRFVAISSGEFHGAAFFRASWRGKTYPVTTVKHLQASRILPKRWTLPSSKHYRRAVRQDAPPFNWIPPSQFEDTLLAEQARKTLFDSWSGNSGRWQASTRVVSGQSLCLALRYSKALDVNIFRVFSNHV